MLANTATRALSLDKIILRKSTANSC